MTFSLNNRLIVEPYIKEGLKKEVRNGIAVPGQRDSLKGLRVLIDATLSDGRRIPSGSTVYIREEVLHSQPWASKPLTCDTLPGKFLVVELSYIDFIDTMDNDPKDAA